MHLINNFNDSLPLIGKESLKYIIFSDSTLCSSCELNRMYLWDCFLNKIKDLKGKVEVYFIFSPSSSTLNSFYFTMKVISPTSPIFVDTTNVFLRSNPHIPENPALHTFLLSEDNEVLLVGNPLENKRIEEMFWRIVKEK